MRRLLVALVLVGAACYGCGGGDGTTSNARQPLDDAAGIACLSLAEAVKALEAGRPTVAPGEPDSFVILVSHAVQDGRASQHQAFRNRLDDIENAPSAASVERHVVNAARWCAEQLRPIGD